MIPRSRAIFFVTSWVVAAAPTVGYALADAFGHRTFFIATGWSILGGWWVGVLGNMIEVRIRERRAKRDREYFNERIGDPRRGVRLARHRTACAAFEMDREHREKVAMDLLWSHLTEEQFRCLRENGYFFVPSRLGMPGRNYKVTLDWAQNVELDTGASRIQYCVVPADGGHQWPLGDIVLAQLLLLRHDEDTFLRKAYKTVNPYRER